MTVASNDPTTGATASTTDALHEGRSSKGGWLRSHPASAAMYWVLLALVFLGSAVAGPLSRVELGGISAQGTLTIVLAVFSFGLFIASWSLRVPVERYLRSLGY